MAIFALIMLATVGLWGWSLIDILGRGSPQWRAIGQDRTLWLLVVLFVGVPGALGYLLAVKPKFDRLKALGGMPMMPTMPMIGAAPPGWYPDPMGVPVMRWFDGRQWTPQTAAVGSVPQGGVPQYGAQGHPQYGQPQHGHPQHGQPQYGQPQYGQPQYGQPLPLNAAAPMLSAAPVHGPPPGGPQPPYPPR